jgi:hypothetical protein
MAMFSAPRRVTSALSVPRNPVHISMLTSATDLIRPINWPSRQHNSGDLPSLENSHLVLAQIFVPAQPREIPTA